MKEMPIVAQGQLTPAVSMLLRGAPKSNGTAVRKRRKKATTTATRRKKKTTRRAAPKGRLKKGSAAAKQRMAKLRAMRRKKR